MTGTNTIEYREELGHIYAVADGGRSRTLLGPRRTLSVHLDEDTLLLDPHSTVRGSVTLTERSLVTGQPALVPFYESDAPAPRIVLLVPGSRTELRPPVETSARTGGAKLRFEIAVGL